MAILQIQQQTHLPQNTLDMAKEFQINLKKGLGPVTTRGTLTSTLAHTKHPCELGDEMLPRKILNGERLASASLLEKISGNYFAEIIFFHKSNVRGQYTEKFDIGTERQT